jgi:hypothetical protein
MLGEIAGSTVVALKFGITWGERLGNPACPYMRRWVLNLKLFSFRVHHWYAGDDERCFYDHSWWFWVLVLRGSYWDISHDGFEIMRPGTLRFREALFRHTVKVNPGGCWTLLLTGKQVRRWGFWPDGKFLRSEKYFKKYGHHPCQ